MEENYSQLCVWPGTRINESEDTAITQEDIDFFEKFMLNELNARVKYHTTVSTLPDLDEVTGNPVPDTGGRSDLFFYVHTEDVERFALPRLKMGIRWWEDVIVYNNNSHLYTKEFLEQHPPTW